jgi:hypothetical protein
MKKLLKILLFLAIFLLLLLVANRYLLSGRSSYQSIYLVPANAAWIIESDDPFGAWNKIIHSEAWNTIGHIESMAELDADFKEIDSVFNDQIFLLKILGKKQVMISCHEYQPGKFDYLYILNLGKITRLRNPEKIIASFLGNEYPITKRNYKNQDIYEMHDRESGEMYTFCFIHDKIMFTTTYKLIEASLDETDKMTLGRDLDFINVSKRISGKGLFDLYINYTYFPGYLKWLFGKTSAPITDLKKQLSYSAFAITINAEGLITLDGYTAVRDTVSSFYSSVLHAGNGGFNSSRIIPARIASLIKISFENASDYYRNSMANLNKQEFNTYSETLQKLEKKLKINVEDNLFSWMDDEIVLLQTQPSNLGRSNEFAAIIESKNENDARTNMAFIAKQIKKNSPVKVKSVPYQGYTIYYISFPGLIKALFGKTLEKIDRPYYTQIDNYVIFSNHPQTLKNIIDDYTDGKTLDETSSYAHFTRRFDRKSSAFMYLDIPVLFSNMQEFLSTDAWQKLLKNKPYITSFSQAGIQIDGSDNLLRLRLVAQYSGQTENYSLPHFDGSFQELFSQPDSTQAQDQKEPAWFNPEIIINDLDAKKMDVTDENGKLLYVIELKNGIKQGSYKAYYPNGTLKVSGRYKNDLQQGRWKLFDENGNPSEEKEFLNGIEKIK